MAKILFAATFLPLVAMIGGGDDGKGYHWVAVIIAVLAGQSVNDFVTICICNQF